MRLKRYLASMLAIMLVATVVTSCGHVEEVTQETSSTVVGSENVPSTEDESTSEIEKTETEEVKIGNEPTSSITVTGNFSYDLFSTATLNDIEAGNNVMISPLSVLFAMGMVENGAANNTLTEISSTINDGKTLDELNNELASLLSSNNDEENTDVKFNIANSIWVNTSNLCDVEPLPSFEDIIKTKYKAIFNRRDFTDSNVKNEINNWVSEETSGMIPSIIDEISANAADYLINCIAMKAKWADETPESAVLEKQAFRNQDNTESKVTMFEDYLTNGNYIETKYGEGFLKYYAGNKYCFIALRPKDDSMSLSEFLSKTTPEELSTLYENRKNTYNIKVRIPEFELEYSKPLTETLQVLGIKDAFIEEKADFSNLCKDKIYITKVLHKTYIKVDRDGTEAAATTAIECNLKGSANAGKPKIKEIYLDRPFIYAIINKNNNIPIFMGAITTL